MNAVEQVAFVTVESGDDMIVSFFITAADDPSDGRSLTLLRSAKWEHLLPEWERGVHVSDEALPEESLDNNFLQRIRVGNAEIELESTRFKRNLDIRRLDASDLGAITTSLQEMNFDGRFALEIL